MSIELAKQSTSINMNEAFKDEGFGVFIEKPLSSGDYQSMHVRTVDEINEHLKYAKTLRAACDSYYEKCDKEYPEDCASDFEMLNRTRNELRKVKAYLNHLHRVNTHFKLMMKVMASLR